MAISYLYIDLNSFFASCEQQENPKLRGKPIAVVPLLSDTTSVIAASYEAKRFGIKTGTKVRDARQMCPGIQFISGNHKTYIQYHHRIIEAVESCVPVHSICSIDEIACELKGSQRIEANARLLAAHIKKTISEKVGVALTSSIGIGPNILLSKVAADMKKPDGLTVIDSVDLPAKLYPLGLEDIPGIGPRMAQRLRLKGITTMEALLGKTEQQMHALWGGILGERMHRLLRGEHIAIARSETKSISHQHVLPPKDRNFEGSKMIAMRLAHKAAVRLRKAQFVTRGMRIDIKCLENDYRGGGSGSDAPRFSEDFKFHGSQDTGFFLGLIEDYYLKLPRDIRPIKINITYFDFIHEGQHQLSFFEDEKKSKIYQIVDKINEKYGRHTVYPGTLHEQVMSAPTRIAFSRIPELDEV